MFVLVAIASAPAWGQETGPNDRNETERNPMRVPDASASVPLYNVGYGPLRLSAQSPFQALRLQAPLDPPSSLAQGHWELRETTTWSRMWAYSDDYLLDYETMNSVHSVVYGIHPMVQMELGAGEGSRFGGSLDGFVRDFHDLFGIDQHGRSSFPRGTYAFRVAGRDGQTDVEESRGRPTEYLFVALHHTLTDGSETLPAISWSFSLRTPLREDPYFRGEPIEAAASISLSKRWGDLIGYVTLGVGIYGNEEFAGLDLRPFGFSLLGAVEWNLFDQASLVFQYLWSQGAVLRFGPFSEPSHEIGLGLKIEVTKGTVFEIGAIENIVVFDNSPDFGIHAGLTVRF